MFTRFLPAALVVAGLAIPAMAAAWTPRHVPLPKGAEVTVCTLQRPAKPVATPATVWLVHLPNGRWSALDNVTARLQGRPVPAHVLVNDAKRVTFGWRLLGKSSGTNQFAAQIKFRLTVVKSSRSASLAFLPQGYREQTTFGHCAPPRIAAGG